VPEALPLHAKAECNLSALPTAVFAHIDTERLSAHMARRSWQMAGTSMTIDTDADGGRRVGSRIRLAGRVLGVPLFVDGVVVRRDPPRLKAWDRWLDTWFVNLVESLNRHRLRSIQVKSGRTSTLGPDWRPSHNDPQRKFVSDRKRPLNRQAVRGLSARVRKLCL
jgi:hypothetical protein